MNLDGWSDSMNSFVSALNEMDACDEAVRWVDENDYDLETAWVKCEKTDWMFWLVGKLKVNPELSVKAAKEFAAKAADAAYWAGDAASAAEAAAEDAAYWAGDAARAAERIKLCEITRKHIPVEVILAAWEVRIF